MKILSNILLIAFVFFSKIALYGQQVIPVWSFAIPNSIENKNYKEEFTYDELNEVKEIRKISTPTLTLFLAPQGKANGTAVVICPGGGYSKVVMNKEGYIAAKWLNSLGISAFVLKYRLPSDLIMFDKTIGPLQDAQEAMRIVRKNAKKWNIDPNKIGVMGFSAGGHLAATISTHYKDIVYNSEPISARPDFSILVYPVISMEDGITHNGSKSNLLGLHPTDELIEKYSNEKQVDGNTPKAFLVHAVDDKAVPLENSINYLLALKKNNLLSELHIYEEGGHGFGLGRSGTSTYWTNSLEKWFAQNQLLQ
jgi:acetyl esterase/lipase